MSTDQTEWEWGFRIAKLELQPGDVLVVSVPDATPLETIERAHRLMKQMLGERVQIMFKNDTQTLTVLKGASLDAIAEAPGELDR